MATARQKLAVRKILENPAKPLGQVMREVGYHPNSAKNPSDLTGSKAYREMMEELPAAGFHTRSVAENVADLAFGATKALVVDKDIREVPDNGLKLNAMRFGAEMMGWLKQGDTNIQVNVQPILAAKSVPGDHRDDQAAGA